MGRELSDLEVGILKRAGERGEVSSLDALVELLGWPDHPDRTPGLAGRHYFRVPLRLQAAYKRDRRKVSDAFGELHRRGLALRWHSLRLTQAGKEWLLARGHAAPAAPFTAPDPGRLARELDALAAGANRAAGAGGGRAPFALERPQAFPGEPTGA